jgi:hypothetical protein
MPAPNRSAKLSSKSPRREAAYLNHRLHRSGGGRRFTLLARALPPPAEPHRYLAKTRISNGVTS